MDGLSSLEWRRVRPRGYVNCMRVPQYVHRLVFDRKSYGRIICEGWQVRYPAPGRGSLFFCDSLFGGTRAALRAAIAYLDDIYTGESASEACRRLGYNENGGREWTRKSSR